MKVLIVDDDADIRQSIKLALSEQDHVDVRITESADVVSGIKQTKDTNPDVVILDLHMQNKNGWDFMRLLHKNARIAKTRVVMVTADDSFDNIYRAEKSGIGAYQFISKPFDISELQSVVLGPRLPIRE